MSGVHDHSEPAAPVGIHQFLYHDDAATSAIRNLRDVVGDLVHSMQRLATRFESLILNVLADLPHAFTSTVTRVLAG